MWERYQVAAGLKQPEADRLLTPYNHTVNKGERYYQQIAINRTVEEIPKGDDRILLTMATGTGKTAVAFQICWKLWNARWNRTGEHRRPKILYLADRNILVANRRTASGALRRGAVQAVIVWDPGSGPLGRPSDEFGPRALAR